MNINVIGGADGPTSIFVAGQLGPRWIDIVGLVIVLLIMLPNIVYAVKFHGLENKCKNRGMNILEQIGRYASMFFMTFHIGLAEFGFSSVETFIIYMIGNVIFIIAYWIIWITYFVNVKFWKSMALAIIPTIIFLTSGISSRRYLLVVSAIIFGIGHVYVTYQNTKED